MARSARPDAATATRRASAQQQHVSVRQATSTDQSAAILHDIKKLFDFIKPHCVMRPRRDGRAAVSLASELATQLARAHVLRRSVHRVVAKRDRSERRISGNRNLLALVVSLVRARRRRRRQASGQHSASWLGDGPKTGSALPALSRKSDTRAGGASWLTLTLLRKRLWSASVSCHHTFTPQLYNPVASLLRENL